jgi:UDPglucose 6-dehydrogenase
MKIAIVGTGYVGLVSGACFAEIGHHVVCVDRESAKVKSLKMGEIPIFEPGLKRIVADNQEEGRLKFTTSLKEAVKDVEAVFIAVGTPEDPEGRADLSHVYGVVESLAPLLENGTVIVTKSTVPVGTGKQIKKIIAAAKPKLKIHVVSNPEFLREGCAVRDFMEPDRIVVGCESEHAMEVLDQIYRPLTYKGVPLINTTIQTAELIKYASNAFLALKIGFINEIADVCEKTGADIAEISHGIGLDKRIGSKYLSPGPGYGGSCLPKDTMALRRIAQDAGVEALLMDSVIASNDKRILKMVEKISKAVGGLKGKKLAMLGLAFKADTDDVRHSPAISLLRILIEQGAEITAYDPEAMEQAKRELKGVKVKYAADTYSALKNADGCVIATEWGEFMALDIEKAVGLMKNPVVVDLRNLFNPRDMKEAGVKYVSIGR